jgi:uncharacterized protein (DUF305 family)
MERGYFLKALLVLSIIWLAGCRGNGTLQPASPNAFLSEAAEGSTAEINSAHKSSVNKLTKLSGAEFDREYVKAMVEDHEKDVKAFELQSQGGADEEVKNFAAKTLPVLQRHLQMAREMQNKMK